MIETIRWKSHERLVFLGRNGTFRCTGIEILQNRGVVTLQPITSKDQLARCDINIPVSSLSALTQALDRIRRQSRKACKR